MGRLQVTEKALAGWIVRRLRDAGAQVQRLEDRLSAGVPDLSLAYAGAEAWVELKAVPTWPARPTTRVFVDRNRTKFARQVAWLEARGRAGSGCAFVVVRVDRDLLVFPWPVARRLVDGLPRGEFVDAAAEVWRLPDPDPRTLVAALTTFYEEPSGA